MLYLQAPNLKADPKVISRRASYLPVRLAFHRYPQVIQKFLNIYWFGPPRNVTHASSCSWIDHWVSGLMKQTKRPIKARFHYGSDAKHLNLACPINSLAHYAKGTPSQINAPTACKRMVSGLFHSPHRGSFHLSLTVLVHYRSSGSI